MSVHVLAVTFLIAFEDKPITVEGPSSLHHLICWMNGCQYRVSKLSMSTEVVQNTLIEALKELIGFGRTALENVEKDVAKGILNNFYLLPGVQMYCYRMCVYSCMYSCNVIHNAVQKSESMKNVCFHLLLLFRWFFGRNYR